MNFILAVGILIIAGYFGSIVASIIRLPRITGYLVAGVALSPSLLNIIPEELIHGELTVITDIALGIIAYLVGGNFEIKILKKIGRSVLSVTIFEGLGAWLLVFLFILILGPFVIKLEHSSILLVAIVIGAISLATAPAATFAIIRQYRAKGLFTTLLLNVVALDDAVCIIVYALAISIVGIITSGVGNISLYGVVLTPVTTICGSILLGIVIGSGLISLARFIRRRQVLLVLVIGAIVLTSGLAKFLGISALLANMAVGFVVINWTHHHESLFRIVNDIEDLIFVVFFTLAGTHFNLEAMKAGGFLALLIVLGRCAGKYLGASIGGTISGSPLVVRKYLGLALLPKAGVTIGLVLLAGQHPAFSKVGMLMVNAVLASTIINELIAPPLVKYALFKSGEATSDG